jgi:hypothetical protein
MYIRLSVMSIHNCPKRNAEAQLRRRQNPTHRIQEQVGITHTNPEDRAQEQVIDTTQRQIPCTNLENRAQEQVANTARRQNACTNPENRAQEQVTITARRRLAREWPGVLENEALQWWEITYQMATKHDVSSGTYLYHQPCRVWNVECQHGCGYTHLSKSDKIYKKEMLRGWDCHPVEPIVMKMQWLNLTWSVSCVYETNYYSFS